MGLKCFILRNISFPHKIKYSTFQYKTKPTINFLTKEKAVFWCLNPYR